MLAISLVGLLAFAPVHAPATGTVRGRVTDSTGAGIPRVQIIVHEIARLTSTDSAGRYVLANLSDGTYGVSFSAAGYAPVVRRVTVAGADQLLDITLRASLIELAPLQVTASPLATTLLASPQPAAVLGGADLRSQQAASLGETIAQLAGVHSLGTGVGIGKPVIRGLTSNRVLLLEDGQRMETAQWGDEHGPNLETATAERIEVIRGPASVLYGSDALGGVVNVLPRALPRAEGGASILHGNLSAGYGTNNREPTGSLLLEGARGRAGFRATLSARRSGDLRTPEYPLWNSATAAGGGSGALGYHAPGGGGLVATFSHRAERIRLTDEDAAETPLQRIATSRGRLDLTLPLGPSRLEAKLGYERNRRREFEERAAAEVALGLLSTTWTGLLHFHHPALGRLNGIAGFSGFRSRFDKFGEESLIPESTGYNGGLFVFEQAEAGRFSFSFGARYDYRRLAVGADAELGVAAQTRAWHSLTGNLGLLFHATEPVALVLNVGRGYRAPSSFDLFANGVHEGTLAFERGNPALRNETSLNTDLALRVQSGTLHLELGGFANLVEDFIFTVPSGEVDPESGLQIFDVTQGDARLTGVELSAQYHPVTALHFQAVVDYTHGQNTTTDQPLPLIPPFRANYSVRVEGNSRGSLLDPYLLLGGETNGRQGRLDPAEAQFYAAAFDGDGYQSSGYTLVNLGAGAGLLAGGTVLRVDLSLRNLLNQRWANHLNRIKTNARDPGMGRNLLLKATLEF